MVLKMAADKNNSFPCPLVLEENIPPAAAKKQQ
jgi:hypothetical protein